MAAAIIYAYRHRRHVCVFLQVAYMFAQLIQVGLLLMSGKVTSKEVRLSCSQQIAIRDTIKVILVLLECATCSSEGAGSHLQGSHCHSQRRLPQE